MRCGTYECQATDLTAEDKAAEWRTELQKCCREICAHVRRHCGINILSGNFYFKIDRKNIINLCYTTCIKADRAIPCLNGDHLVNVGLLAYSELGAQLKQSMEVRILEASV